MSAKGKRRMPRKKSLSRSYNFNNPEKIRSNERFMSSRRRVIHTQETYRFSVTHTLSDYPLLIGEILRRDERRVIQLEKRRSLLYNLRRALGMRAARTVGAPKSALRAELTWQRE
jgi:hypothetical protein